MRPESGFTLLEFMIVLVLVGIFAALAYPRMSGWLGGSATDAAISQMATDLDAARSFAVRDQARYALRVTGLSAYEVARLDPAGNVAQVVLSRTVGSTGSRRVWLDVCGAAPPASIVFDSRGFVTGEIVNCTIAAEGQGGAASGYLTAAGRLYVQ